MLKRDEAGYAPDPCAVTAPFASLTVYWPPPSAGLARGIPRALTGHGDCGTISRFGRGLAIRRVLHPFWVLRITDELIVSEVERVEQSLVLGGVQAARRAASGSAANLAALRPPGVQILLNDALLGDSTLALAANAKNSTDMVEMKAIMGPSLCMSQSESVFNSFDYITDYLSLP